MPPFSSSCTVSHISLLSIGAILSSCSAWTHHDGEGSVLCPQAHVVQNLRLPISCADAFNQESHFPRNPGTPLSPPRCEPPHPACLPQSSPPPREPQPSRPA